MSDRKEDVGSEKPKGNHPKIVYDETLKKPSVEKSKEEKDASKEGTTHFWDFLSFANLKKKKGAAEKIPSVDLHGSASKEHHDQSDEEKLKSPAGKSMIDIFNEEKNLDTVVEKILRRHEFHLFTSKKKKKAADFLVAEKINKAERFKASVAKGLSAAQVEQRVKEGLSNKTKSKYTKTYWEIIKDNVFTFFNVVLIALAACIFAVGESTNLTFLLIMAANIAIGIVQEVRSKRTVEKLKLVTAPTASAIRDGGEIKVPVEAIVLDDIISLSIGDQIPADSIIADGAIEVNESLLTGESLPVKKQVGDTVYAGSFVTSGTALARVDKVAEGNWAIGLQAKAKKFQKPRSELLRSLNAIIKIISIAIVPVSICLLVIGAFNSHATDPYEIFHDAVMNAAGPIIGSVPAGMFLLTSMALAVGVVNMSKKHTLVQDLYCFEMLARTNVLCLDKTGTLTDGTMQVSEVIVIDKSIPLERVMGSYLATFKEANQTSLALSERYPLNGSLKVVGKIPFSSSRKYSAVSFQDVGTFVLGAPEFVYRSENKGLVDVISTRQRMGYRVIMLAKSSGYIDGSGEIRGDVVPVALFVLLDHVRNEAPQTIKWFNENGVQVKIISGDNPLTASEIAGVCGVPDHRKCVSLEGLSLEETAAVAQKYTVFGRVSPEQKAVLIRALKQQGKTVAMTGDGVNDILAMKQSDCSVAMASGADAAKNVAHLVLLNSDFASMPSVVLEGRRVINNVQRSSALYLMKTIFTFVMAVAFIILGFSTMGAANPIIYPFLPSDILLMEFVGIGVPSVLLALQPDRSQIKGHFIKNTFSKALPGALVLLLVVAITFVLAQVGFFDEPGVPGMNPLEMPWVYSSVNSVGGRAVRTLAGLGMCFGSLSVLFALSQPFDTYRFILFVGDWILLLFVIFGIVPYRPFNIIVSTQYTDLRGNEKMILMGVIYALGCPLLTAGLMKAFHFFLQGDTSKPEPLEGFPD